MENAPSRPALIRTRRLALRRLAIADARWIRELFNDPEVVRFVGDRGIRTREDAERYLTTGPIRSYERFGFGLWRVERASDGEPVGIAGLVQRHYLPEPDLGFAILAGFRRRGYASEAAEAVLKHARGALGIRRLLAITTPDNETSREILRRLGLKLERKFRPPGDEQELCLYVCPIR